MCLCLVCTCINGVELIRGQTRGIPASVFCELFLLKTFLDCAEGTFSNNNMNIIFPVVRGFFQSVKKADAPAFLLDSSALPAAVPADTGMRDASKNLLETFRTLV